MTILAQSKRRLLANLNVFVPLFAYGYLILEAAFDPGPMPVTSSFDASAPTSYGPAVPHGVVLAWIGVLALIATTIGLSPKRVAPGREARHRLGHTVLGAINLTVFATALLPLLLANLTGIEAIGHLMWLGLPVLILAPFVWPVGLGMVWTSRGRAAAKPEPL